MDYGAIAIICVAMLTAMFVGPFVYVPIDDHIFALKVEKAKADGLDLLDVLYGERRGFKADVDAVVWALNGKPGTGDSDG